MDYNNRSNIPIQEEESIDIKEIFFNYLKYWYWFVIAVIVAFSMAFIYNRITLPVYRVATTVLVGDEKKGSTFNTEEFFEGFGMFAGAKNLENELEIIKSYALSEETIKRLNICITYFNEDQFKSVDLYKNAPFIIEFDSTHYQPVNIKFFITLLSPTEFQISCQEDQVTLINFSNASNILSSNRINIDQKALFGVDIQTDELKFKVTLKQNWEETLTQNTYSFQFNDPKKQALWLQEAIEIQLKNKNSSIVEIGLKGTNINKTVDLINTLVIVYLEQNLHKKNRNAENTIEFIDSQLSGITDSLFFVENRLQDFRKTNKIMDLGYQGQFIYSKLQNLETEKSKLTLKSKYYDYIKEYFKKGKELSEVIAPSSMGIDEKLLDELILKLTNLNSEKARLVNNNQIKNYRLHDIDIEISILKETILENIENIINTSKITIKEVQQNIDQMLGEVNKLPATERKLVGIERIFKINENIYTFLLEKRAEAQIAKASNLPDNEVVDGAKYFGHIPISPNNKRNYLISIFIGLLIPGLIIFLKDYLNEKIKDKRDIEKITDLPFVGHVLHNSKSSASVIKDFPRAGISESFRSIRTNLQFFAQSKPKFTMLITSSIGGEGKSFNALNLAISHSMFGSSTILLGFDLRRPSLYKDLNISNSSGLSNYLINKSNLDDVIQKTQIENLDCITSGPIPPNPSELISSKRTKELFDELKKRYDYIIIDTPPVGVVSDALLLNTFADVMILIVRQQYTHRKIFSNVIQDMQKIKDKSICVLMNDLQLDKAKIKYGAYNYIYQYGYYYNSDYFDEEKKQSKKKNS